MGRRRSGVGSCLLAVLVGCQGGDDGGNGGDSGAGDGVLLLSSEPTVSVGLEEPVLLHRVVGAQFFGDGVAIANGGTNEILLLDAGGELEARRGGPGAGPGEYGNLAGMVRSGPGLVALDSWPSALVRLDETGNYVGSARLANPEVWRGRYARLTLRGAFAGQALLESHFSLSFPGQPVAGPMERRPEMGVALFGLSDGAMTYEAPLPGVEIWFENRGPMGPHGSLEVPFGRTAVTAVAVGRAWVGDTDTPVIRGVGDGDDTLVPLFDHVPVPVRPEWVRHVRDTIRARTDIVRSLGEASGDIRDLRLASADFRQDLLEDLPARATLPAFEAMMGGLEGHLWVRLSGDPAADVVWVAFDEEFAEVQRMRIPRAFEVLDLSLERVLVLRRTELREEVVEIYPVVG